jgi:3-methyladenine DNA glycosylase AlkD
VSPRHAPRHKGADTTALVKFARKQLRQAGDAEVAAGMAAYMKTTMACYGVKKPEREAIARQIKERYPPSSQSNYHACIRALWRLPHREEKYLALDYARMFRAFITPAALPLFENMVRQGAWWDFVDDLASRLIGTVLRDHPELAPELMDRFIEDPDMWIRRTALLCQLKHGEKTDHKRLFRYCLKLAHEQEFFIRKAIGWALRGYSYTEPDRVKAFLKKYKSRLSPLSYREGAKVLVRRGLMSAGA